MRTLFATCLIAFLAGALAAQTTPRTTTQPSKTSTPKTSLAPASNNQRNSTAKPQSNTRTAQPSGNKQQTVAPRTDNGSANARSTQTTANQGKTTQTQKTTGTATPQPATANTQNSTTTKTVATTTKKTTETKVVNPVKVKWITLEDAIEKSKTDKRKIFVDVFTDWCGWCKRMDSTTFVNPTVAQYINDHYYPVKFNAEQKQDIVFKDKTYQFKKVGTSGYHELAAQWLNNRLTYPSVVFLDESQGTIQSLQGYQDATKMEAVLNYFSTDSHKKTPWETYQKNFKSQKE